MDMSKYKTLFLTEAREHLQGVNDCILVLESDPGASESINELFRHAHSIKGMSASMGFGAIAQLSHRIEDLMDSVRKGQVAITPAIVDVLLEGTDSLEGMVDEIENDSPSREADEAYLAKLKSIIDGTFDTASPEAAGEAPEAAAEPAAPPPAEQAGPLQEPTVIETEAVASPPVPTAAGEVSVNFKISSESQVPCARAYLAVKKMQGLGDITHIKPSLSDIKEGRCTGAVSLKLIGSDPETVSSTLSGLVEMGEFHIQPPPGGEAPESPAPAEAEVEMPEAPGPAEDKTVTDPLPQRADPISTPPAQAVDQPQAPAPEPTVETPIAKPPPPRPTTAKAAPSKMVRISTALLDNFINLVGELIVTKSRIKDLTHGSGSRAMDQVVTQFEQLVGSLHTEVMKVRMMPLETVTQRLPRVVRDLSRERGKNAVLHIEGAEIELDRAILEELGDPLIHILRNSVDHGLESPEDRKAANKDENGKIVLKVYRERDMVFIEVSDDRRGMDLERIKSKAVEKGLISSQKASAMEEEEAVMLVCRPGFSTAEQVTDVSGRGVGMDVVQSVVDSIGGSLSITSTVGEGTTFVLKLPLTVAIVKMLLVEMAKQIFAIPITRVVRTIRVPVEEVSESQGRQFLNLEEELIPLYKLRELLKVPNTGKPDEEFTIVLVEVTNRTVGILIDGITGQEDIVIKPLCYPLENLIRYSGMTVLGDGRIVPILDLGNLF